tara:strand:- start:10571 stop:11425 length:855 start_codon:yes stop_codon:yes gene_type:complete
MSVIMSWYSICINLKIKNIMKKKGPYINQEEIAHYLRDVRKLKILTVAREKELSAIIQSGKVTPELEQTIRKELVDGNLRFVISIAKDYQNQGIPLSDLINEGNFGLLKAIDHFDWSKGFRFISYAVWWIKQSILQCLNEHSRTIRLPANVVQELQKAKKQLKLDGSELTGKLATLPSMVNLDKPINEEGDTLLELIKNEDSLDPEAMFDGKNQLKIELRKILGILDDREKKIVEDYFGLFDTPKTLAEIGKDFSLTKERVRQIKEKALRKLRNESRDLLDYIG